MNKSYTDYKMIYLHTARRYSRYSKKSMVSDMKIENVFYAILRKLNRG